ncbi:MAG: class GN sortase [Kangiella sp.]|nr:MAG: class GN sortase [Kangiella sp.]
MKSSLKWLFVTGLILSGIGLLRIAYYHAKAEVAQMMILSAWEESQATTMTNMENIKPWPWADTWPVMQIEFPDLNESSIVLKDVSGESLAFGPGLMTDDILPGDNGNSFIAAHRDTHFRSIGRLKRKQTIHVTLHSGISYIFKIDKIKIVDSRSERPWTNTDDKRITLVTCYPFDGSISNTPFRYLVSAVLI